MKQRDLFISHASQDAAVAKELRAELEGAGYTCWMAPDDIVGSRPWAEQILSAIESSRVMVVLISGHANESVHVSREVNLAVGRARAVLPIRIEDVAPGGSLEYLLSLVQRVDAFPPPVATHSARIRRMIDAVIDSVPQDDDATTGSDAPAAPVVDAVRTEPSTSKVQLVEAAVAGPVDDHPGRSRQAASRIRGNVVLAAGAGGLVLVGLAILGGMLVGGGASSSSTPSNATDAGRATPSSAMQATPSAAATPSTGSTAPGSPNVPTPAPASAAAAQLLALIPQATGSCGSPMVSGDSIWIAQLVCSSGAPRAVSYYSYSLYLDTASMREDYEMWLNYYGVRIGDAGPCVDGLPEEGPWRPDTAVSGVNDRFFCGAGDGSPGIMWTDGTMKVLAEIKGADGADLGELYALWSSRAFDPVRP